MRILLGTYDVCGWLSNLGRAFAELGHEVTMAVSEPPPYFEKSYDVILPDLAGGRPLNEVSPSKGGLDRIIRWMDRSHRQWKYTRNIHALLSSHDLVVKMWHPFIPSSRENEIARSRGIRIVQLFVGSDARYMPAFRQQYDVSQWDFPSHLDSDPAYQLSNIRLAERYADLVYSVPDQAGLQLRPYLQLQAPMEVGRFRYSIPGRDVPRIVHAPSVPWKKGTDIIESAMEALQSEGLEFEFISLREVPHHTLLGILMDADILVDEIICHGPGALSIEAMLCGCAVATRYLEDSPECFRPPVCSIQADNIIPRLRHLITDKQYVRRLAEDGRAYALRHYDDRRIASQMLCDLETPREPDYHPRFLRDHYIPRSESETRMINEWTAMVRHCDWYLREIAPGIRSGLVF